MQQQGENISVSLIYKKINHELTEGEEKLFQEWLKEKPEHLQYFEWLRYCSENCPEGNVSEEEINEAWRVFRGKADFKKASMVRSGFYRWVAVAASVAVVIGSLAILKLQHSKDGTVFTEQREIAPGKQRATLELANGEVYELGRSTGLEKKNIGYNIIVDSCSLNYTKADSGDVFRGPEFNKLSIPRGGEYQLKLEDGTKVWLNSESQLKYPQFFTGHTRDVFLEGEAYFEVAKDVARPFIVHAGVQKITVLGTSFGITSYRDEETKTTTLVEGRVKVEFPGISSETYLLEPGYQVAYINRNIEKKQVDVREFVAWHEGKYVFTKKRLEDMMSTLSRWYDFQVFYQNPGAKEVLFSGELMRFESFTDILHLIEKTSDVKFEINQNVVRVTNNN